MVWRKKQFSLYGLATLLLIVVPIVHLVLSVTFSYRTLGKAIQPVILSSLTSAMELRRLQVQKFFADQDHEAHHLAKYMPLNDAVDRLQSAVVSDLNLRKIFLNNRWQPRIRDAKVLDNDGNLKFSLLKSSDETRRIQSLIPRQSSSGVYTIFDDNEVANSRLVHSLPIVTSGGFEGTLVIEKALASLDSYLLDRRGLQNTGETLLIRRNERREFRYASPLRFPEQFPDAMLVSSEIEALLQHLKQPSGLSEVLDYRGVPTFAMFAELPVPGLFLMVKLDQAEALFPLDVLRIKGILLAFGGVLLGITLAYLFSRAVKKPLVHLVGAAAEVENGNYDARAPSSNIKEIDEVVHAFNKMATSLITAIEEKNVSIQELEYFTRYATHDLHEPTKELKKGCEIIRNCCPESLPTEVRTIIEQLEMSADSMNDIISGMRILSTLSKAPLVRTHLQLEEILLTILTTISKALEANKTQVVLTALPTVYVSQQLLPYLYRNLTLTLAQMGDVGRRVMTFFAEPLGDSWILGIKVFPRLFLSSGESARFYSAGDLKYKFHDHEKGMGLALCRKIVARHDGDIWVVDSDTDGTVLRMVLHFQTDNDRERLQSLLADLPSRL